MTCFNKEYYKELKRRAKEDNVVVHTFEIDKDGYDYTDVPYNGYSVAFTKPRDGLRMVEASVSYCAPEDKFKRKHGKYHALRKMYAGESLMLPLGKYPENVIAATLQDVFLIY